MEPLRIRRNARYQRRSMDALGDLCLLVVALSSITSARGKPLSGYAVGRDSALSSKYKLIVVKACRDDISKLIFGRSNSACVIM